MNPKIRTPYMGSLAQGETNTAPSLTVPDQDMSVREIIRRSQSGLSTSGIRVPSYDGETDPTGLEGRDFRTLDLSEKHDLLTQNRERIYELQQKAQANRIAIEQEKQARRNPKPTNPAPVSTGTDQLDNPA